MCTLDGKIAIVTGAASGIGRATVMLMATRGARVTVADIAFDRAQEVVAEIRSAGGTAMACAVDVGDEEQIREMVHATVLEFGSLDILHNNAADMRWETTSRDVSVTTMDAELWDHVFRINLRSVMLGSKWAIPEMQKRGGGAIVNTSSVGALRSEEAMSAYGPAKAAISSLTQYIATTHGKQGIRCNAIAPGFTLTPAGQATPREVQESFLSHTLTPYLGQPEDIAEVAVFLASDAARFVTGQTIAVDGGLTIHLPHYADMRRMRGV